MAEPTEKLLVVGGTFGETGPLESIAQQTGFYDQSHLTLHFKRVCGLTPRAYANQALPHGATPAIGVVHDR